MLGVAPSTLAAEGANVSIRILIVDDHPAMQPH